MTKAAGEEPTGDEVPFVRSDGLESRTVIWNFHKTQGPKAIVRRFPQSHAGQSQGNRSALSESKATVKRIPNTQQIYLKSIIFAGFVSFRLPHATSIVEPRKSMDQDQDLAQRKPRTTYREQRLAGRADPWERGEHGLPVQPNGKSHSNRNGETGIVIELGVVLAIAPRVR